MLKRGGRYAPSCFGSGPPLTLRVERGKSEAELYNTVEANRGYLANDLELMFEKWFDRYLKTHIYKQYQDLETTEAKFVKEKPRGGAFAELDKMIGLTSAKEVISQALDFYNSAQYVPLCYVVTTCQALFQEITICFYSIDQGHMEGALDLTVPGIGHSVIRGLATSGQWSAAGSTVLKRESQYLLCQHRGDVDNPNLIVRQSTLHMSPILSLRTT